MWYNRIGKNHSINTSFYTLHYQDNDGKLEFVHIIEIAEKMILNVVQFLAILKLI